MYLKCVSHKGKKTYITNTPVGKRCFKLNHQANNCPQGAFDDRAQEGIFLVMLPFLSIFSLEYWLLFIAQ